MTVLVPLYGSPQNSGIKRGSNTHYSSRINSNTRKPFNRHARIVPETPSRTKEWSDMHRSPDPMKSRKPRVVSRACNVNGDLSPNTQRKTARNSSAKEKDEYGFRPHCQIASESANQVNDLINMLCRANGPEFRSCDLPADAPDSSKLESSGSMTSYCTDGKKNRKASDEERSERKVNPTNIIISETPRIKFIAEKFARYKKKDIELRRLTEKIVCVEYDVYDKDNTRAEAEPVQILRAYFSIKPPQCTESANKETENDTTPVREIPSEIMRKYRIADDDLKKLNEKEIEIIDETIAENQSYLNDLKAILKRKQDTQPRKTMLDLMYLYEMAKRDCQSPGYDFSKLLTVSELTEVRDLILKRCASSMHGISRFVKKCQDITPGSGGSKITNNTILELVNDLEQMHTAQDKN